MHAPKGLTLIELLMVLVIVSILGGVAIVNLSQGGDAQRFEATRTKMNVIRNAILGDDTLDNEGNRRNFGYHGDMGGLPATLSSLATQSSQPSWAFATAYGIGAGWRGPYLDTPITGSYGITQDAWGTAFTYSHLANPPYLESLGANRASGGSGTYDTDLRVEFPDAMRMSTVRGYVTDRDLRLSGYQVEARYPSGGSMSSSSAVTDANGYFRIGPIPFGLRALSVASPTALAPRQVFIDRSDFMLSTSTLNYRERLEALAYVAASALAYGPNGNAYVSAQLTSTYSQLMILSSLTLTWDVPAVADGFLMSIGINGSIQPLSTGVAPATPVTITSSIGFPANQVSSVDFRFAVNSDGTGGYRNMSGVAFTLVLSYVGRSRTDSISFTTP